MSKSIRGFSWCARYRSLYSPAARLFQAGTRFSVLGKIPGKPAGPDGRTQVFLSLNFFKADFANRNAPLSCSRNITKYEHKMQGD